MSEISRRSLAQRVLARLRGDHERLWYHVDSPASLRAQCVGRLQIRGWAASPRGQPVRVFRTIVGQDRVELPLTEERTERPGGRMLVDNINLLSDEGWGFFVDTMEQYHPLNRPANVSRPSTPQELRAYFERAGFVQIQQREIGRWTITSGIKPGA